MNNTMLSTLALPFVLVACAPSGLQDDDLVRFPVLPPGSATYAFSADGDAPVVNQDNQHFRLDGSTWVAVHPEPAQVGRGSVLPSGGMAYTNVGADAVELWALRDGATSLFATSDATFLGELALDQWLVANGATVSRLTAGGTPEFLVEDAGLASESHSIVVLPDGRIVKTKNDTAEGLWLYGADGVGEQLVPCSVLDYCAGRVSGPYLVNGVVYALVGFQANQPQEYTVVEVDIEGRTLEELSKFPVEGVRGGDLDFGLTVGFGITGDGRWYSINPENFSGEYTSTASLIEGRVDGGAAPRVVKSDLTTSTQLIVTKNKLLLFNPALREGFSADL